MIKFSGPDAVKIYQATAIKQGLKLYMKTGMRPNRAFTPTAMMRTAENLTGKKFKARDYQGAIDALQEFIDKTAKDGIS